MKKTIALIFPAALLLTGCHPDAPAAEESVFIETTVSPNETTTVVTYLTQAKVQHSPYSAVATSALTAADPAAIPDETTEISMQYSEQSTETVSALPFTAPTLITFPSSGTTAQTASAVSSAASSSAASDVSTFQAFHSSKDYQNWAESVGYPQGILTALGVSGINQDYFHSAEDSAGYRSGRIVIGDSRCCQLGIMQQRMGSADLAAFAIWGGHYLSGTGSAILSDERFRDIERCFFEQIRACGHCTIYFFATVNDYNYASENHAASVAAAISAAERLAGLSYEQNGQQLHPTIIVIGIEGGNKTGSIFSIPSGTFNQQLNAYNSALRDAFYASGILSAANSLFTTVPSITNDQTTYISDGLHYSDETLSALNGYIIAVSNGS